MSTQTPETPSTDGPIKMVGKTAMGRRRFLMTSGMVAGVAVAAVACGSDNTSSTSNATTATTAAGAAGGSSTTTGGGGGGGDIAIAKGAAGLEVLAVNTYGAALDAATAGDLGDVPAAVAEYATTAKKNHKDALDAWNGVLTGAGEAAVTDPPADLATTVNNQFAQVTDVGGVAALALMLEQTAADTYLAAQATLEGSDAKTLAGSIQIVDMQHAAVLHFVMGDYPVPDVFQNTDNSILS